MTSPKYLNRSQPDLFSSFTKETMKNIFVWMYVSVILIYLFIGGPDGAQKINILIHNSSFCWADGRNPKCSTEGRWDLSGIV